MIGPCLRRLRNQKKYANIAIVMRIMATGIIASPAIDLDERPCFSCGGVAGSDIVVGIVESLVDVMSNGIVNCCD